MGIYAKLIDISPKSFNPGDAVNVNLDIYNNEGAKYVVVEIKDVLSGATIWKWQEFSQLGETNVQKTLTVPNNIPGGNLCLEAFANGNTLPEKLLSIEKVYVNGDLVWSDGEQIKTAWVELPHPLLETQPRNKIKVVFKVIPIYSDKALVTVYPPSECLGSPTIGSSYDMLLPEGTHFIEYEVYSCSSYNARDLLMDYYVFPTTSRTIPSGTSKVKWFDYTFGEAGNFMLLFQKSISYCGGVEVYLNGTSIGRQWSSSLGKDLAFNLLNVNPGDRLEVYAIKQSAYFDYLCVINASQIKLVKERVLTFPLTIRLSAGVLGKEEVVLSCRGFYDNWFGGKR